VIDRSPQVAYRYRSRERQELERPKRRCKEQDHRGVTGTAPNDLAAETS
jgi:hypothetical protein